jgi:hypothetical protein
MDSIFFFGFQLCFSCRLSLVAEDGCIVRSVVLLRGKTANVNCSETGMDLGLAKECVCAMEWGTSNRRLHAPLTLVMVAPSLI